MNSFNSRAVLRVGSREYDTVKLGLKLPDSGYWVFDTQKDGNHNTGHEYGTDLSEDDRMALLEYLKGI